MRKSTLKGMKSSNRQLIVETIQEYGGLSRVEIAQHTELSASTVSGLVGEMVSEGLLVESGVRVSTAGRSRTELTINKDYGSIFVVEIGRTGAWMTQFDLSLQAVSNQTLSERYIAGNELLAAIVEAVLARCGTQGEYVKLAGVGLLFQEDMRASDFNVMYSTGFSSASISLREALVTQLRVPVVEEYSQIYTITQALGESPELAARSSAHIAIGESVVASVVVEGKAMPLRKSFCADAEALLRKPDAETENAALVEYLGNLIALLCMLFPLETVFLSGARVRDKSVLGEIDACARRQLGKNAPPKIRYLSPRHIGSVPGYFAKRLRSKLLLSM